MVAARVHHADLWGLREGKYQVLAETDVATTDWAELKPSSPFYFFVPRQEELLAEYAKGWKVTDIFPVNGVGMTTARDDVVIDYEAQPLLDRATLFRDSQDSNAALCEKLNIPQKLGWNISKARELIHQEKDLAQHIRPVLYRPFDVRLIFYHDSLVWRTVRKIMQHMLSGNVALLWTRPMSPNYEFSVFATRLLVDQCAIGNKSAGAGISYVGPLYLYPAEGEMELQKGRRPNLKPEFIAEVERRLGMRFAPHPETPSPRAERGPGGEVRGWRTDPQLWARLKPLARQMRTEPTEAEKLLWQRLRNRQLLGSKFRRQHSIERFIVDFYCAEASLVVEVEGLAHQYQQEEDQIRQAYLESLGLRVLRFSNDKVLRNLEPVLRQISDAVISPSPLAERGLGGEVFTPEDIFHYAYAVFHSPTYRSRYAEFLKIDFPHLPLTSNRELFAALAEKGAELVSLHLMESPSLDNRISGYPVPGTNRVEKVAYLEAPFPPGKGRVYINKAQYFEGLAPAVWGFYVGGYQVCEKWLKDRKGRTLTLAELLHYQKIAVVLKETIRLMGEIDALIPSWPLE